jgi:hypothetical protein
MAGIAVPRDPRAGVIMRTENAACIGHAREAEDPIAPGRRLIVLPSRVIQANDADPTPRGGLAHDAVTQRCGAFDPGSFVAAAQLAKDAER